VPLSNASNGPVTAFGDLRARLVWITAFRTVAATLLLLVNAVRLLSGPATDEVSSPAVLSLWVSGAVYLVVLIQSAWLRRPRPSSASAMAHVAGDVLLATALVFLTGGADSPFTFTYLLAVVGAAILLDQRGTLVAAAATSVAYVALVEMLHLGWLKSPGGSTSLPPGRLSFLVISNVLAQFLLAFLAGFLSRQLSQTGRRLRASEKDLRELAYVQKQILESMPSGLITCDALGSVSFVNRAGEAILQVSADELPLPVDSLIPGVLSLSAPQVGRPRAELTVKTPAGLRTLGLAMVPLSSPPGARLIVFQDLTQLRHAEEDLRRADRLAELGALSAELAHEIRNPLAAMRGSAELLAEGGDSETRRLLGILRRESDRLGALVDDFLAFARPPAPVRRRCALDELVRQTVELLSADPLALGVQVEVEPAGLEADVDPDQLRQVLLNIFRNAFAAAGGGGRVRAYFSSTGEVRRIHVWDSAGSIASTDLPHIFEPFFSKTPGGTGLGLSTVHSIVRAHGGHVHVSSSPTQGTEFVVALSP
jgi:two-component system sensor histidine kinase PilS (NtrC family)